MADYNWDMTGPPDEVTIATDPEAVQSYNEWIRRKKQNLSGENVDVSVIQQQEIVPPTYEQQVEKAQSLGMSPDDIAQYIGTPQDAKQRDIDAASNIYNLYGFTPTWADKVGYTVNPDQQEAAIKSSGINYNTKLSSSDLFTGGGPDYAVQSAYNKILGRNPTQEEFDAGLAKMGADNLGFPSLISDLTISSEAKSLLEKGVIGQSTLDQVKRNLPSAYGYLYPQTEESWLHGAGGFAGDVIRYGVPLIMAAAGGWQALTGEALGGAAAGAEAIAGGGDIGLLTGATEVPSFASTVGNLEPSVAANIGSPVTQAATNTNLVNFAPGVSDAIGYVPSSTVESIATGVGNVPGVATGTPLPTDFGFNPALPEAGSLPGTSLGFNSSLAPESILGSGLGSGGEIGTSYLLGPSGAPATDVFGRLIKASSVGFGGYPADMPPLTFPDLLSSLIPKIPSILAPGLLNPLSLLPKTPTSAQPSAGGGGSYVPKGMVDYSGILGLLAPKTSTRSSLLG
jgi:hypothetical protein